VKTLDENRWLLIRGLFGARERFLRLFRTYERRVLRHAKNAGVDRRNLRLTWAEVRRLLDFQSLEDIRDEDLEPLKEVAHDLFRSLDSTDKLDILVSQIYHEISILKEEHYTFKEDFLERDAAAYDRLYGEIKQFYPARLRHVRGLFDRARRRLERILPGMMEGSIVVRSLYLFGGDLVGSAYRDGLVGLYRKAYPGEGEARGFLAAARSFRQGGFLDTAAEALEQARQAVLGKDRRKRTALAQDLAEERAVLEREIAVRNGIPETAATPAKRRAKPRKRKRGATGVA
jgi:hypothetical protein